MVCFFLVVLSLASISVVEGLVVCLDPAGRLAEGELGEAKEAEEGRVEREGRDAAEEMEEEEGEEARTGREGGVLEGRVGRVDVGKVEGRVEEEGKEEEEESWSTGPPQVTTHSSIVSKLFSFPRNILYVQEVLSIFLYILVI